MSNVISISAQLVLLLIINVAQGLDPLVQTNVGLIKGLKATDGAYSMFMGIPYARVDEANPFGPSTPYGRFDETFEAFDDSAICPQVEEFNNTITGTLDCLHLNIYVPDSASKTNPLPVLVWIYGGGFSIGFAGRYLYGPKYLVQHNVVFVTLNYRLGPYGFMCHGTPDIPGNQGFKDQVLALRWIKENIEAFGGNANKITLFGESAGGVSIDYHLHSPQEKLFNNLILQSGTSYIPALINEGSQEGTLKLASQLGFVTNNVDEAVSFLSRTDSHLVIAAASVINIRFLPCVERGDNTEKFISDYPINTDIPKVKNTAILIGHNDDEMLTGYVDKDTEYLADLNLFYSKLNDAFDFEADELNELESLVRHFYIGDDPVTEHIRQEITNFDSDFKYNNPTQRSIAKYVESGADSVFYYMFTYNGGRNFVKKKNNITLGNAAHCDEIGYLFDISYMRDVPSCEDQIVIDRMTTMWTNFVKYR
ncbi:esterase FE4-like [Epargyreus clarus]|uniref:esterase FE4-like n=1 Tax=Epargyreus clarus TaxID=520877 RepID=UPI003C2E8D00